MLSFELFIIQFDEILGLCNGQIDVYLVRYDFLARYANGQ